MHKHATARVVWGHAPEKILRFRGYAMLLPETILGQCNASRSPEDRFFTFMYNDQNSWYTVG